MEPQRCGAFARLSICLRHQAISSTQCPSLSEAVQTQANRAPFPCSCCRLVAEKINKNERKGLAEVENVTQAKEPSLFWKLLDCEPPTPRIYKVPSVALNTTVFRRADVKVKTKKSLPHEVAVVAGAHTRQLGSGQANTLQSWTWYGIFGATTR